jgi:hypothetical protein
MVGRGQHRSSADRARTVAKIEVDVRSSYGLVRALIRPLRLQRRRSSGHPWTTTLGTGSTWLKFLIARPLDYSSPSLP